MLTPEIVKAAFETAHDACTPACQHAEALSANVKMMMSEIGIAVKSVIADGKLEASPSIAIFSDAFHIGYRAAQLEAEATLKGAN